ncbi:hypothetical protein GCM10027051_31190 [Niabella terrae]
MATLNSYLKVNTVLDFSTGTISLAIINVDTMPALTGVTVTATVKQPDGIEMPVTMVVNTTAPLGATGSRQLRLDSLGKPQKGQYVVEVKVNADGYDETTLYEPLVSNYGGKRLLLEADFNLFTPALFVRDNTDANVSGWTNTGLTKAWELVIGDSGSIGVSASDSTGDLDLKYNGNYYDAEYSVDCTATVEFQSVVNDKFSFIDTWVGAGDFEAFQLMPQSELEAAYDYLETQGFGGSYPSDVKKAFEQYDYFVSRLCGTINSQVSAAYLYFQTTYNNHKALPVHTGVPLQPYYFGFCGTGTGDASDFIENSLHEQKNADLNIDGTVTIGEIPNADPENMEFLVKQAGSNTVSKVAKAAVLAGFVTPGQLDNLATKASVTAVSEAVGTAQAGVTALGAETAGMQTAITELQSKSGWTPIFLTEEYSGKMIRKLHMYTGGTGTAPTDHIGDYLTVGGGWTDNPALAGDFPEVYNDLTGQLVDGLAELETTKDDFEAIKDAVNAGYKPLSPTDTVPTPTANIMYAVAAPGDYTNLVDASGDPATLYDKDGVAITNNTVTADNFKSRCTLFYNFTADKWTLIVETLDTSTVVAKDDIGNKAILSKNLFTSANLFDAWYIVSTPGGGITTSGGSGLWNLWIFPVDTIEPMVISGWNSTRNEIAFFSSDLPTVLSTDLNTSVIISGGSGSIGLGNKVAGVLAFTPPSGSKWAAVTVADASEADTVFATLQVEYGEVPTSYESGDTVIDTVGSIEAKPITAKYLEDESGEPITIDALKNLISPISGELNFDLGEDGQLSVAYPVGNVLAKVNNDRGYAGSNVFNFLATSLLGQTINCNDDVAPMHIYNTTMGANHGLPNLYNATITAHGLDNTSIGTEWVNGSGIKFYVMRIASVNVIVFLSENTGTSAAPAWHVLSTGTLTKGVDTLTVTAVTSGQMYPAVKDLSVKVLKNGITEMALGESGKADFLDVVESYGIKDPTSILTNTIARVGQSQDPDFDGDVAVIVKNIYRFTPEQSVFVMANNRFLKSINFTDAMVSQAALIGSNNGVTYYMVPNSSEVNGYDLKTPTQVTWSLGSSLFYTVSTSPDTANPPNRVIQYRGNLGFQLAFLKTRGAGKNLPGFTARTFEIRNNTGKIYPHAIEGSVTGTPAAVGDEFNTVMVRSYCDLTTARTGNRLSLFAGELNGTLFLWIDYSGSMVDYVDLSNINLNGKLIEVVESKNAELKTDTYNDGFTVKATAVTGESSFVCLAIS